MPERTRLFRLFSAHKEWTNRFLAEPTILGLADSFGIELLHPRRAARSPNQIGRFGKCNPSATQVQPKCNPSATQVQPKCNPSATTCGYSAPKYVQCSTNAVLNKCSAQQMQCSTNAVLNKWGLVCGWDAATANTYDTAFHPFPPLSTLSLLALLSK
jgi:hypothetical protein